MFWKLRKYILYPFWLFGTFLVWFGSGLAFAGQYFVIFAETVESLPKLPDLEPRRGVDL